MPQYIGNFLGDMDNSISYEYNNPSNEQKKRGCSQAVKDIIFVSYKLLLIYVWIRYIKYTKMFIVIIVVDIPGVMSPF